MSTHFKSIADYTLKKALKMRQEFFFREYPLLILFTTVYVNFLFNLDL